MNTSQQDENTMTNTIDLHRLIAIFRNHYRMMIIWTLVAGILGFAFSKFVIIPKYTATTEILVNQKHASDSDGQAYNNQQADVQIITTYKDIITNQVILNKVSDQLDSPATSRQYGRTYEMSANDLKNAITISNQQNSQVFSVAVKTDNPEKSAAVANTIASVFKKQIKKIMSVNNVTIVSKASVPESQSFPNIYLFTLAGAVLGFLLSIIWLIIKELLDTTINTDDYMTNVLGLTDLGHVSHIEMQHHGFNANQQQNNSRQTERRV